MPSVHDMHMAKKRVSRLKPEPRYGKTFIKEWREHRGLTQEQLGERVGKTYSTIGRIENGLVPYGQGLLEALADALGTDPASLLMRDPGDPEGIWTIWDRAKPAQRQQILAVARALLQETGT